MRPSLPESMMLLGQGHRRDAAVVVPDGVEHAGLLDGLAHVLASAALRASGFSHRIILPAAAAAMAISRWRSFGVQMSMASMSGRAMSLRQSVSMDS
jgi:hypothetical protein